MMGGTAGFYADQGGRQVLEELDDFGSAQFFANDDLAGRVDIVNLESAWRDQVQLSMWASDLTLTAASVRFPLSLHETCSCCGFRFIPAGYSDVKPATIPI